MGLFLLVAWSLTVWKDYSMSLNGPWFETNVNCANASLFSHLSNNIVRWPVRIPQRRRRNGEPPLNVEDAIWMEKITSPVEECWNAIYLLVKRCYARSLAVQQQQQSQHKQTG